MTEPYFYLQKYQIPLYGGMLIVIVTNERQNLAKYLPEFKPDELFAHACFDNWKGQQGFFVILNPSHDVGTISVGTIAHEAVHIASYIASERGFVADFDNDEPIAYFVQWVADTAWNYLQRVKAKLDKPKEKE